MIGFQKVSNSGIEVSMRRDAIKNMLIMQSRMNEKVHECGLEQEFEWYRAVWIECAELMDHLGYKWWKKQTVDSQQVRLEEYRMCCLFYTPLYHIYALIKGFVYRLNGV